MKGLIFTLVAACAAFGQSTTTKYSTDISGNRVAEATSTSSDDTKTELNQSINGREVPLQSTEEKVLKSDSSGKTTERIVHKYDQTGRLISTDRTIIEEQKTPGGGSVTRSTTYRTDINGRELPAERSTIETQVHGSETTTNTTVERPTINGSFDTAEKRASVSTGTDASRTTTESVYRPNGNGGFDEAVRSVTDETKSGNTTVKRNAEYEIGVNGSLQLHEQTVSTTSKEAGGNETTQVDLYAPAMPGIAREANAAPQIKEEQIISRQKGADGSLTETLSIRRPTLANPNKLGSLQKLSETVCRGKCDESAQTDAAQKPVASADAKSR